jgi:hypothetical protein
LARDAARRLCGEIGDEHWKSNIHMPAGSGFMAYVPAWERLSDVMMRVMAAAGLLQDEAQTEYLSSQ